MTTRVLPAIRDMRRRSSRANRPSPPARGSCWSLAVRASSSALRSAIARSSCFACSLELPHPLVRRPDPLEEPADPLILRRDRHVALDLLGLPFETDRRSRSLRLPASSASRWPRRWSMRPTSTPTATAAATSRVRERPRLPIRARCVLTFCTVDRRNSQLASKATSRSSRSASIRRTIPASAAVRSRSSCRSTHSSRSPDQAERQLGGG